MGFFVAADHQNPRHWLAITRIGGGNDGAHQVVIELRAAAMLGRASNIEGLATVGVKLTAERSARVTERANQISSARGLGRGIRLE
jgi:hypothetical protein